MKNLIIKFKSFFLISGFIYYLFLIVQSISLYFNEFGFDLINGMIFSFSQISTVINFGVFIGIILVTAESLRNEIQISHIFKFGLIISLIFGGLIFFLSNSVAPKLKMKSFLDRYENAREEPFTSRERTEKEIEYRKISVDMMSLGLINQFSDSLKIENKSQRKIISDLMKKIPDSIIQNNFSNEDLNEYGFSKNQSTVKFNNRDLYELQTEIRTNRLLLKSLKKSNWTKDALYINSFLPLFLILFGIVIGTNFKNQLVFSLVCIGIVVYSQILSTITTLSDYFINGENLINLLFKFTIIIIGFLYLGFRMINNKNTGANKELR